MMLKRHLTLTVVAIALVTAACSSGGTAFVDDGAGEVPDTTVAAVEVEQTDDAGGAFMVQDGDLVEVHYDGTLDDGSTFDSSRERGTPFSFEVGTGQVIPGFDDAVRGLKIGESREVRIPAAEAYGVWSDENIVEVPYGLDQSDVAVGDQVYLNTGQAAIVLEVKTDTVVLDANHELAGQALTFKIEVLSITRP
jgi:FKBP-type peptidyl-prolyl cis-trans isomerase 2